MPTISLSSGASVPDSLPALQSLAPEEQAYVVAELVQAAFIERSPAHQICAPLATLSDAELLHVERRLLIDSSYPLSWVVNDTIIRPLLQRYTEQFTVLTRGLPVVRLSIEAEVNPVRMLSSAVMQCRSQGFSPARFLVGARLWEEILQPQVAGIDGLSLPVAEASNKVKEDMLNRFNLAVIVLEDLAGGFFAGRPEKVGQTHDLQAVGAELTWESCLELRVSLPMVIKLAEGTHLVQVQSS